MGDVRRKEKVRDSEINRISERQTKMKHTLGVEGKGQQMSFRMTHDSFNPRRNSTVCVSLPCGSTACYKTKLTSSLENACSKPVIETNDRRMMLNLQNSTDLKDSVGLR